VLATDCAPLLSLTPSVSVMGSDWLATLDLRFKARLKDNVVEKTLLEFNHQGPLRIQKALYPDGPACCHAVVVHPPGGIAAGDCLRLDIDVQSQAQALVTTPSATKWYGAFEGGLAQQSVRMRVAGHLQWIPAETIIYDGAYVRSAFDIDVAAQGSMFGWDTQIYGRHGSGERFLNGSFDQSVRLSLDGELVWLDRLRLSGADALFDSPVGLQGHHALATCWAVLPADGALSEDDLMVVRAAAPEVAFTQLHDRVLVGRLLGDPLAMRTALETTWRVLQEQLFAGSGSTPRLWAT